MRKENFGCDHVTVRISCRWDQVTNRGVHVKPRNELDDTLRVRPPSNQDELR